MGKSHSLYHIKRYCDERGDVVAVILKLLSEDELKNFGVDFIRRIFKSLDERALSQLRKTRRPRAMELYPEHTKVLRAFAAKDEIAGAVLTGRKPTRKELAAAGIKATLDNTEVALEFLAVCLSILHDGGQGSLVVCVDEAEYIFSQTSARKAAQVFNAIRAIYDLPGGTPLGLRLEPISNLIFFFAISTAGMEKLQSMERVEQHQGGPIQPLLTRIEGRISLSRLTKDDTESLVAEYLRVSRTPERQRLPDPLIPYDEDLVEYLYTLTKGHPRDIVTKCDYVISEGLKDKVPRLTKKYAREVFSKWNLPV
jgi:hypothetical protein